MENRVRPTKLGAKNHLYFGSAEAGANNALLYTLIGNCRRKGLDPESYLAEAIRRLPAGATPEQAAALTPARAAAARPRPPKRKSRPEPPSAPDPEAAVPARRTPAADGRGGN